MKLGFDQIKEMQDEDEQDGYRVQGVGVYFALIFDPKVN